MRVLVAALALLAGPLRALAQEPDHSPWPTLAPVITTFAELEAAVGAGGAYEVGGHIVFERGLTINGSTTLNLTSSTGATLSGGGAMSLFRVEDDAVAAFHRLTLRDGKSWVRRAPPPHVPPPRTPLRHSHILRRRPPALRYRLAVLVL